MNQFVSLKKLVTSFLLICTTGIIVAQTEVSGTVLDNDGEPVIAADVTIKGKTEGTTTDLDGKFDLKTNAKPPFIIEVTALGLGKKEIEVTKSVKDLKIKLEIEAVQLGDGVVVSASRVEEKLMESPVTIEKLDPIAVRQSASADYYDEIGKLKGVQTTSGSLTFTSVNTRGFAAIANTRFVQLMDGMDNAAPLLNFPTGNIVGIGELDISNVELVPGAASALYGPNAFNGILLMNSKSPFDFQGLSAQVKLGVTESTGNRNKIARSSYRQGNNYTPNFDAMAPLYNVGVRYAKALSNKFAFKLNFSYLSGQDWPANDYSTDRNYLNNNTSDITGANNRGNALDFDGMNTYGDENRLSFASPTIQGLLYEKLNFGLTLAQFSSFFSRSGFKDFATFTMPGLMEESLLDTRNAKSIKGDISLHYRITKDVEAIYSYRIGSGNSIYQGSERYALRDFLQQFHKLEFKGKNWFARAYASLSDAGKSYNLTALGTYMLTSNKDLITYDFGGQTKQFTTGSPVFGGGYVNSVLGRAALPFLFEGYFRDQAYNPTQAQVSAVIDSAQTRTIRELSYLNPGASAEDAAKFNALRDTIMNRRFQKGGASFIDDSRMYHTEFNYDFSEWTKNIVDVQIGANYRLYSLYTAGTIFNEDPDKTNKLNRINISEFGVYTQVSRKFMQEKLKLMGSIRYDKNQNFDGQFSPRLSAVYSTGAKREHNIRASFQTGFRNPATQDQYIYFPTSNILIGGARDNNINAQGQNRYNAYNTPVVTLSSLAAGKPDTLTFDFVKPERLFAYEIGYKGVIANKLLIDLNAYYNEYTNFQSQINVRNITPALFNVNPVTGSKIADYRIYVNDPSTIRSWGVGLGLTYKLPKNFSLSGNYTYAAFDHDASQSRAGFEPGFNTPAHRFNLGLENRNIIKNLGFSVNYRWQTEFLWQNSFGNGMVPSFSVIDAQVNYVVKSLRTQIKLGANNILGSEYQTNTGGPYIGRQVYVSLTFDEFMK
jgi:outer membrane receptor protein involved in Fe transport